MKLCLFVFLVLFSKFTFILSQNNSAASTLLKILTEQLISAKLNNLGSQTNGTTDNQLPKLSSEYDYNITGIIIGNSVSSLSLPVRGQGSTKDLNSTFYELLRNHKLDLKDILKFNLTLKPSSGQNGRPVLDLRYSLNLTNVANNTQNNIENNIQNNTNNENLNIESNAAKNLNPISNVEVISVNNQNDVKILKSANLIPNEFSALNTAKPVDIPVTVKTTTTTLRPAIEVSNLKTGQQNDGILSKIPIVNSLQLDRLPVMNTLVNPLLNPITDRLIPFNYSFPIFDPKDYNNKFTGTPAVLQPIQSVRNVLTAIIKFPYLSKILPSDILEQLADSLLDIEEPIRQPIDQRNNDINERIKVQQKLNTVQIALRKLLSANLKYIPIKTVLGFVLENAYTSKLTDNQLLSILYPYTARLNSRISLLKQLRFNLKLKEKNETDPVVKNEIRRVLQETEEEITKIENSDNLKDDGIVGRIVTLGDP